MKTGRTLAATAALAVTMSLSLLSATPVLAAGTSSSPSPSPSSSKPGKPTLDELLAVLLAADKAHDEAKAAAGKATARREAVMRGDSDLARAAVAAKTAAETAAAGKTAADEKLTAAKAALAALPAEATPQERTAAEKAVTDAQKAAEDAAAAKTAADTALITAVGARDGERVDVVRLEKEAKKAESDALKAADDAGYAYQIALAQANGQCHGVRDNGVTAKLSGPEEVKAGTSVDVTLRLTSNLPTSFDSFHLFSSTAWYQLGAFDNPNDKYLTVRWFNEATGRWEKSKNVNPPAGKPKKGVPADIKLRLTVDARADVGSVYVMAIGTFKSADDCVVTDTELLTINVEPKGATPGPGTGGGSGTSGGSSGGGTGNPGTPQGGSSTAPVNTGSGGPLAETGSDSALPQIALAGGAAVALGAGAMFLVRRRKAGADA
ncbi:LAETG motif-containing sortase-dependent surface protein [Streptomyces sp. NPDC050848]|uniref:LAETG motif-containing sortase-dependent surface protein n=1 Tax=Streptomyces sp. NPDC050848 TaxID=3155791 RepID=UPI0034093335